MAGLALHGDLTGPLADASTLELRHRLESVKFLSPVPRAEDDPANYGAITKAAVALAEERNPDRVRTICSAATNPNRYGDRPSRWSAPSTRSLLELMPPKAKSPPGVFRSGGRQHRP